MPDYVTDALEKYQHIKPKRIQHTPHKWTKPAYCKQLQFTATDTSPKDKKGKRLIQSIVGTFLYYGQAIETSTLVALNEIGTQ